MSALWPTTLPSAVQVSDLQITAPDMVLRSEVDTGPAMLRRRFTAAPELISGSLKVTRAQLAIFRTFYVATLGGGAIPFEWFHPQTRVIMDFRFRSQPSWRPYAPRQSDQSDYWTVSLDLETVPGSEKANPTDPPGPGAGLWIPPHQFNDATGGLPTGLDPETWEDIPIGGDPKAGGGVTGPGNPSVGPPSATMPGDSGSVGALLDDPGGTFNGTGNGSFYQAAGGGGY